MAQPLWPVTMSSHVGGGKRTLPQGTLSMYHVMPRAAKQPRACKSSCVEHSSRPRRCAYCAGACAAAGADNACSCLQLQLQPRRARPAANPHRRSSTALFIALRHCRPKLAVIHNRVSRRHTPHAYKNATHCPRVARGREGPGDVRWRRRRRRNEATQRVVDRR